MVLEVSAEPNANRAGVIFKTELELRLSCWFSLLERLFSRKPDVPSLLEKNTVGPVDQKVPSWRIPSGGTIAFPIKRMPPADFLIASMERDNASKEDEKELAIVVSFFV